MITPFLILLVVLLSLSWIVAYILQRSDNGPLTMSFFMASSLIIFTLVYLMVPRIMLYTPSKTLDVTERYLQTDFDYFKLVIMTNNEMSDSELIPELNKYTNKSVRIKSTEGKSKIEFKVKRPISDNIYWFFGNDVVRMECTVYGSTKVKNP